MRGYILLRPRPHAPGPRLREPVGGAVVVGGDEPVGQEGGQRTRGLVGVGDETVGSARARRAAQAISS
ncbi:hypothetical protein, partial [Actinomyces sp. oral taxon 849]|uniref:hypothetical protein n=1 Tax=Actinomyces sp. oral taxon 849 TaxID=653385 RepID=UPI001E562BD2